MPTKEWCLANREHLRAYKAKWKKENKEKARISAAKYYAANKEKVSKRLADYYEKNPEKYKEMRDRYYLSNRESVIARSAAWRIANPDRRSKIATEWTKANPEYRNNKEARRRAAKLDATPLWANQDAILLLYRQAKENSDRDGYKWHVDHIVPLKSKLVCGLHVEGNLRVIPAILNLKKSNKFWPDMPERVRLKVNHFE